MTFFGTVTLTHLNALSRTQSRELVATIPLLIALPPGPRSPEEGAASSSSAVFHAPDLLPRSPSGPEKPLVSSLRLGVCPVVLEISQIEKDHM